MILLALQCCPHDSDQALELVRLIVDNEPTLRWDVDFAIAPRHDTNPFTVGRIIALLKTRFTRVFNIKLMRQGKGWPAGPNDQWHETMGLCSVLAKRGQTKATGVLTFEPDCLFLRRDWINVLNATWDAAQALGKKVVGHACPSGLSGPEIDHINGNAIFAIRLSWELKLTGCSEGAAWDVFYGRQFLEIGMDTPTIYQVYKMQDCPREKLEMIRKDGQVPALFHGAKDPRAIAVARAMMLDGAIDPRETKAVKVARLEPYKLPAKANPKTAIFIKSYPGDYDWLKYCLRSIRYYATGFSEVVVVIPTDSKLPFPVEGERVIEVREWESQNSDNSPSRGYYHQMFVKLTADRYTDADCIVYIDSDCILTKPFDASEMFDESGRPKLLARTWEEAGDGICWKEPAEHALGWETTMDTMARHPSIYRRSELPRLREHIEAVHGMPFEDYVRTRHRFIEFVTMGNFILRACRDDYEVVSGDNYPNPIHQNWSWANEDDRRAAFDELEARFPTSSHSKSQEGILA